MNQKRTKGIGKPKGEPVGQAFAACSGRVIAATIAVVLLAMLFFGHWLGWDLAWRSFGVEPLHPEFFDSHAITDHAACAAKGFDAYVLTPCAPRTPFNYP